MHRAAGHGQLRHRGVAPVLTIDVDAPGSTCAADANPGPAHGREHGVTVADVEEAAALAGISENLDGFLKRVLLRLGAGEGYNEKQESQHVGELLAHGFVPIGCANEGLQGVAARLSEHL